jgi:hypothetical protein
MLSNLSDLLMSRVDPDPVQAPSQSSMVAMSPQSQAMAQQQAMPPAQAQYLQSPTQPRSRAAGVGKLVSEYKQKYPGVPNSVLEWMATKELAGVVGEMPSWGESTTQAAPAATTAPKKGMPANKFNEWTKSMTLDTPTVPIGETGEPLIPGFKSELKGNYKYGRIDSEGADPQYHRFLVGHGFEGMDLYNKLLAKEKMNEYLQTPEAKEIQKKIGRQAFEQFAKGKSGQILNEVTAKNSQLLKSLNKGAGAGQ